MSYAADGNLTIKRVLDASGSTIQTDSLFWSAGGSLDSLKRADSVGARRFIVTFGYDAGGRRVRYSWTGAGPTNTQRFLWDGGQLAARLGDTGGLLSTWTYYPNGEPESIGPDTAIYYMTDAQHNTVGALRGTSAGGDSIYQQTRYGPFGENMTLSENQSYALFLYFKGAYRDVDAGLYLMGARYYDAEIGRFISEDPAGLTAGINLYVFAVNDPVGGWDPSGMQGPVSANAACTAVMTALGLPVSLCPPIELPPIGGTAPFISPDLPEVPTGEAVLGYAITRSWFLQSQGWRWQERGPAKTTDCSHFACDVLNASGHHMPYLTTREIPWSLCYRPVSEEQAQYGDAFIPRGLGHVGFYAGYDSSRPNAPFMIVDWGTRMKGGPLQQIITHWTAGSFFHPVC